VFENVKSCRKIAKNLEKCMEKCEKSIETVEKFGLFFTLYAQMIETPSVSHQGYP
jgi:hypothetical protein